jgi:hypothetical protein
LEYGEHKRRGDGVSTGEKWTEWGWMHYVGGKYELETSGLGRHGEFGEYEVTQIGCSISGCVR